MNDVAEIREPLPLTERSELPTHPLAIIDRAIERGIDADNLAKLMELQERWENRRAAEVYASALAAFQKECPLVFKGREADRYKYASYDDIKRAVLPIMARHEISTSFTIDHTADGRLAGTCRVRVGAHFEDHKFTCPIPATVKVNDTQQYGAALSYLKRYLFCAALDIVVTDEDNDGQAVSGGGWIDAAQAADLDRQADALEAAKLIPFQKSKFLAWLGVADLRELPAVQFKKAADHLARKRADLEAKRKAGGK